MTETKAKANEDKPAEQSEQKTDAVKPKAFPPVVVKGNIKVFPDKRLPQFDQGLVKAYEAVGEDSIKAFAMVCEKGIIPQAEIVHKYAGITTPHIPKLIACSVAEWSVDFKQHFIMVYEDKLGKSIAEGRNPTMMGLKSELVLSTIFRNLLDIVHAMRDKGIAHGGIRVQNLFDGGSSSYENAMLGEMLSTPSGLAQPVLYETITRGLASPLGRGLAEISDDIYALGVTLANLTRNFDDFGGMSDDDIVQAKMDIGSFNLIVGKSRFPAPVLEFMRGTLQDDVALRWTFDDIMTWAEGQRVSAKQQGVVANLKASRPLEFMRKRFLRPQILGAALPKDSSLVVPLVENGELYLWLNRSIQDKELEKRYDEALVEAKKDAGASNYADRLASVMAISMAPENPICYRNLRFLPAGFGALLVDATTNKKDLGSFVDIIHSTIIGHWNKYSLAQGAGTADAINRIGNAKSFLIQMQIGSGLERCIYYLSPMAPCFSEKLDRFYVRTAEDYLLALEKMSEEKNRMEWFLDRHIVAFLSVRDKAVMDPYIPDIASTDRHRQRHGVLKMFAAIQMRDKMGALPGLSQWIAGMLDPLIDRFHDREKRKRIREQLDRIKGQGNLDKIAALFGKLDEIQQDARNFAEMMRYYQALKKEYYALDNELLNNKNFGTEAGKQTAMIVSGVIAGIVVAIYMVYIMTVGGGGKIF